MDEHRVWTSLDVLQELKDYLTEEAHDLYYDIFTMIGFVERYGPCCPADHPVGDQDANTTIKSTQGMDGG